MPRSLLAVVMIALLVASHAKAGQESVVAKAQTLYAAARYEDALALLERADARPGSSMAFDVLRYRALCWLALGQEREAERAIAALVDLDPFYAPAAPDVAPRVAQAFTQVRAARLPGVIRGALLGAHRAVKRRDAVDADRQLAVAVRILADPVLAARPELVDLRLAADALSDLRTLQGPAEPSAPATEPGNGSLETGPQSLRLEADSEPIPLFQTIPEWHPSVSSLARTEMEGAVRLQVDWQGRVLAATIERPTYPAYDRQVLAAARTWLYRPAQRDGVPVGGEVVVSYSLKPPAEWQIFRGVRAP